MARAQIFYEEGRGREEKTTKLHVAFAGPKPCFCPVATLSLTPEKKANWDEKAEMLFSQKKMLFATCEAPLLLSAAAFTLWISKYIYCFLYTCSTWRV